MFVINYTASNITSRQARTYICILCILYTVLTLPVFHRSKMMMLDLSNTHKLFSTHVSPFVVINLVNYFKHRSILAFIRNH